MVNQKAAFHPNKKKCIYILPVEGYLSREEGLLAIIDYTGMLLMTGVPVPYNFLKGLEGCKILGI